MIQKKEILILVSCYNNEDEVVKFANHLSIQAFSEKIFLVVSCNSINDKEKLLKGLGNIGLDYSVLYPQKNLGYLHGCLYGLQHSINLEDFKWVMISNTDIEFQSNLFIYDLLNENTPKDIWCIAPQIILPNGRRQNPFLISRPSSKRMIAWKKIQGNQVGLRLYTKLSHVKRKLVANREGNSDFKNSIIYAAHGSCFILKPECVVLLSQINDKIFMYGEELLIAELIRKNKKKIYYIHDLVVYHNENSTTRLIDYKRKSMYYKQSYGYLLNVFFQDG